MRVAWDYVGIRFIDLGYIGLEKEYAYIYIYNFCSCIAAP